MGLRKPHISDAAGVSLVGVAATTIAFPVMAARTQHPLSIFVVPILAVAALGGWRDTLLVGAAASLIAALEGALDSGIDGPALAARLGIVLTAYVLAVVVAAERERRDRQLAQARSAQVVIAAFQSSLAPTPIPPPGVVVQTRYCPGEDRLQLGGDFYDVITLPGGHVGYIIGDVCGHGPEAAALGSAIRAGWKTIATHSPTEPETWARILHTSFFGLGRRTGFATVNTGYLDRVSHTLHYVSAGHPSPVVIDQSPHPAPTVACPPIGVEANRSYRRSTLELPIGTTLFLYTDGLTENRVDGVRLSDGEAELVRFLAEAKPFDPDRLLERFGPHGYNDDVAVLTITDMGHNDGGSVTAANGHRELVEGR
ncbi:MAG: protein serine/threonine phosphatase [Acidimicrobiia bacterium]|nr:protein serine/threonine phosphatase [Acidimicrobiia bacterium]